MNLATRTRLALLAAMVVTPAAAQTYVVSYAPSSSPSTRLARPSPLAASSPNPNFSANSTQYGVCFYTGFGASPTPIVPTNETSLGNSNYSATITVPASSFQVTSGFDASGFNRSGKFYIAPATSTCTGTYNASLTSENAILIALPPTVTSVAQGSVEQPNTSVPSVFPNVAPPHRLTLHRQLLLRPLQRRSSLGRLQLDQQHHQHRNQHGQASYPRQNSLVVPVPALPNDVSNLTAQVCNPVGTYTSCSAAVSIPVNALIPASGTVNSSASPATLGTPVNLTAEFSPAGPTGPGSSNPMPTGMVTFTSDNTGSVVTIGTAPPGAGPHHQPVRECELQPIHRDRRLPGPADRYRRPQQGRPRGRHSLQQTPSPTTTRARRSPCPRSSPSSSAICPSAPSRRRRRSRCPPTAPPSPATPSATSTATATPTSCWPAFPSAHHQRPLRDLRDARQRRRHLPVALPDHRGHR